MAPSFCFGFEAIEYGINLTTPDLVRQWRELVDPEPSVLGNVAFVKKVGGGPCYAGLMETSMLSVVGASRRPRTLAAATTLLLAACGGSEPGSMGGQSAAGGSTATGGEQAGAVGSAGATTSGSSGASTEGENGGASGGTAPGNEAGAAGTGSENGDASCGGDPIGLWFALDENYPPPPIPSTVDECWNLTLERNGESLLARGWVNLRANQRTLVLQFSDDGTFAHSETFAGLVEQNYAADCLNSGARIESCADVGAALGFTLLGEGAVRQTTCVDDGNSGCDCTFDVLSFSGDSGTWSTEGNEIAISRRFTEPPESFQASYCQEGYTFRLGAEIDAHWPETSGISFSAVNCSDGLQGPGEDGVDCGLVCGVACP